MQWSFQVILSQNARFSTKITNFSPHKNPSGLVGFHSRVRVFSGFSSKVGFGFRSGKNSQGRVFVGFGLDPLHHQYIIIKIEIFLRFRLTLEVEAASGVNSKVHLSLCNSILDFGTCLEQVEHKTIEVLLDFFIVVSFLL